MREVGSMTMEDEVKSVIMKKLSDGTVEKILSEQFENGVREALRHVFASYGDISQLVENKVKSVIVPFLENYDFSDHLVKLDKVLCDVVKEASADNKKILGNFNTLMADPKIKEIKVSDLFERWQDFVSHNIDEDNLEERGFDSDEGSPCYEDVSVFLTVGYDEDRSWSSFRHATLSFECDADEKVNVAINLFHWTHDEEDKWSMTYDTDPTLRSLRYLNEFDVFF